MAQKTAEQIDAEFEAELAAARDAEFEAELAEAAKAQAQTAATMERAPVQPVMFKPGAEVGAERQKSIDDFVKKGLDQRASRIGANPDLYQSIESALRAEAERKFAAEDKKLLTAGTTGAVENRDGIIPMFRMSRIENVPTYEVPFAEPTVKRMYRDPSTGELRPATGKDELVEAAARQTIMGPAEARAYGDQVKRQQEDLAARQAAGEDIPFWVGPLSSIEGLIQEPVAGKGIVETKLGATLRALPSYLAALAAEGYFAGLGYEVDDQGNPVDPTDVAIEIEKARERLGLLEAGGGIPLPGFKTQREDRKAFDYDPDAKRSASKLEYRDDTSALSTFASRVGENLARGRTIGDEMMDVPAARENLADTFESPNAAFWAGSIGDLVMPAGPGLLLDKLVKGGKAAAASKTAAKIGAKVIKAADAGSALRFVESAVPLVKIMPRTQRAVQTAADVAADIAAVTTKGAASEGRVVKAVALRVLQIDPVLTDAEKLAVSAAMKAKKVTDTTDAAQIVMDTMYELRKAAGIENPQMDASLARYRFVGALRARLPDDLVAVSENVFVPRGVKDQALKLLNKATKEFLALDDAGKIKRLEQIGFPQYSRSIDNMDDARVLDWSTMSAETRRAAVEAIRLDAAVAEKGVLSIVRGAREVTEMQTYLGSLFSKPYLDSFIARKARAVLTPIGGLGPFKGIQEVESASLFNLRKTLTVQGNAYTKLLAKELTESSKALGSYSEALSRAFAANLKDEKPLAIWTKLLTETYGARRIEVLTSHLKTLAAKGDFDIARLPTVDEFKAFDKALVAAKLVPSFGAPEYEKLFLKVLTEEGLRKIIIQTGAESETLLSQFGTYTDMIRNPATLTERAFDIAGVGPEVMRVYDVGESVTEKLIANQAEELVRILPGMSVRGRGSLSMVASDIVDKAFMGARNAVHGFKYGYVLPNVPYLMGRLMSLPITSLVTTGVENTMRASGRFTKNVINEVGRALNVRHAGLGLTTLSGETYDAFALQRLVETAGIGISSVDQARLSSLADDLERTAKIAAGDMSKKARIWSAINPAARSFWMRSAEAVENSYRRAMFEGALAAGTPVNEAAELARKSLFDYASTPDFIQGTIGKYFATAATRYEAAVELGNLALNNPGALRAAVKAQTINARVQDPYGLDGDKALKSMGIVTVGREGDETRYYGPELPIFAPIEDVLGVINAADYTLGAAIDTIDAGMSLSFGEMPSAMLNKTSSVATDTLEEFFAGVVDTYEAWENQDSGSDNTRIEVGKVSDTKMFWAAMLAADLMQKQGVPGAWDTAMSILDPITVVPPKQYASTIPGLEQYWSTQPPEGTPYRVVGVTDAGVPYFEVLKPSPRGMANLKIIRMLTPAVMERAFGAGVQLLGAGVPSDVRPDAALPLGAGGAAATFLGEPAGPASVDYRKAQAAERIRQQVE